MRWRQLHYRGGKQCCDCPVNTNNYSTSVSTYMLSSTGVIGFLCCACPTSGNTNNYDFSSDVMRFRLDLN